MHEPGSRETVIVLAGAVTLLLRHRRPRPAPRRRRHLRRRSAAPLREPWKGGSGPARRRSAPDCDGHEPDASGQDLGGPRGGPGSDLHRPASGARGHEPAGLRRPPARRPQGSPPDRTLATADHNVPTDGTPTAAKIREALSRKQVETLERQLRGVRRPRLLASAPSSQGIVHIIGPELGVTQPGMTIVCGDSHTATHGAFGALAFGIGTSEVEHVLATQTLRAAQAEVDAHPLRRASSARASPRRT